MSAKEIARRNDLLRENIPRVSPPNVAVMTRGVASLGEAEVGEIRNKVKKFDKFTKDNDPWGEHDFGAFERDGRKSFWKIDDYRGHEGYRLVLTVMLAEEY